MTQEVNNQTDFLLGRDLIIALAKTIRASRIYPQDNQTLKGFKDQLVDKFQIFLDQYGSFTFQVGEFNFNYKEKILYENKDIKTSLAFQLYKDGIRELRFKKGLEESEIQEFMDIVKQVENINILEDDLVTLMWERDFINISYLATDEFLEDNPVLIPENIDQFRKKLVFKPLGHQVEVDLLEEEEEDGVNLDEIFEKAVEKNPPLAINRSVYFLTSGEVEGLRKEVESEVDPSFVFNIIDILLEIFALEKNPEPYQDAANLIIKILDALLILGEFQRASELLKRVYIIIKTYELKDWQLKIIQNLIVEAGEEIRIVRIGKILEKEEGVRLEDVNGYLVLLQRNAIKPLVKLLGDLKNSKARRMLCDALSEIGKNAIELFTPFVDDRRWFLIRNIIYILGRIGKEQSFPYIQKAFHYQEPRVRREAVQALGLIGGPKAIGLLIKALADDDVNIRAMAAVNLGKVGKNTGLVPLLEVVQSKEFPKKEPTEIKAFFDAIGIVGSNEPIPVLQQLLERKSWFSRGKMDAIRIGAANALAAIGTPEAKTILESGRNSKDESIREACMQAMRNMSL